MLTQPLLRVRERVAPCELYYGKIDTETTKGNGTGGGPRTDEVSKNKENRRVHEIANRKKERGKKPEEMIQKMQGCRGNKV